MKDLGDVSFLLGMQVMRTRRAHPGDTASPPISSRSSRRFGMEDCKAVSTPVELKAGTHKSGGPVPSATTRTTAERTRH